jgi:coenzyme F420-0:L-glutamate ligase/coenzyme F420-1:gamma-L-glutamate ligase
VNGPAPDRLVCLPVTGLGEVGEGDDLAALLSRAVDLEDGDVVVVTSKDVSKAEGRVVHAGREDVLAEETDRVVARRGRTAIVRTRHGLVMAAAGVDASNTEPGTVVLLPVDPDASARRVRAAIARQTGRNVAVVVTDTAGRAWRNGQTDIAVGAAGLQVLEDYAGRTDAHGNALVVTAPAVADELAAAADLVKRKLDRRPAAVVRGLAALVLPPGEDGPGATALVRDEGSDMFGLGAREAVLAAVLGREARGFGAPCSSEELVEQLSLAAGPHAEVGTEADSVTARVTGSEGERGATQERMRVVAFALGWRVAPRSGDAGPRSSAPAAPVLLRFAPVTP